MMSRDEIRVEALKLAIGCNPALPPDEIVSRARTFAEFIQGSAAPLASGQIGFVSDPNDPLGKHALERAQQQSGVQKLGPRL